MRLNYATKKFPKHHHQNVGITIARVSTDFKVREPMKEMKVALPNGNSNNFFLKLNMNVL
jgi:hypothetical protein